MQYPWVETMKVKTINERFDSLESNEDIYSEDGREELVDNDEIDSFEEAFMKGYEESG